MKILIVALNYAPELTGIGKYVGEMATWAAARGDEVVVVTAPPYYPAWEVHPGYSGWQYHREVRDGVSVRRCPLWVPTRQNAWRRIVHLLTFAVSSAPVILWEALRRRPDLVFVVEPPLFCAPMALLAARLSGARAWLHVQDFEVDAAFQMGLMDGRLPRRLIGSFESRLMRGFDRVSTISQRMLAQLAAKKVANARTYLFPNWVDVGQIRPDVSPEALRAELGLDPAARVLLYSGTMGQKHGLEILIDAAARLQHRTDLVVLMCGDGPVRAELEARARGLSNVRFTGLQPQARLNELLNLADVHLLPQRADAEDLVMPSKLTAMMASGRPVVTTARAGTELASVVERCGVVVPPADVAALVEGLLRLVDDRALHDRLGEAARRLAIESFDQDAVLSRALGAESVRALAGEAAPAPATKSPPP